MTIEESASSFVESGFVLVECHSIGHGVSSGLAVGRYSGELFDGERGFAFGDEVVGISGIVVLAERPAFPVVIVRAACGALSPEKYLPVVAERRHLCQVVGYAFRIYCCRFCPESKHFVLLQSAVSVNFDALGRIKSQFSQKSWGDLVNSLLFYADFRPLSLSQYGLCGPSLRGVCLSAGGTRSCMEGHCAKLAGSDILPLSFVPNKGAEAHGKHGLAAIGEPCLSDEWRGGGTELAAECGNEAAFGRSQCAVFRKQELDAVSIGDLLRAQLLGEDR